MLAWERSRRRMARTSARPKRERRLEDVGRRRARGRCGRRDVASAARCWARPRVRRELAVGRDAHADEDARRLAAGVKRQAALPGVERGARVDEALGRRGTGGPRPGRPTGRGPRRGRGRGRGGRGDRRARRSARAGPAGAPGAATNSAPNETGRVALGLDDDHAGRGRGLGRAMRSSARASAERLVERAKLERRCACVGASPARGPRRSPRGALDDLVERDGAVEHGHLGLAPGAVHAQGRGGAEALDADLPGLVVEADDRLAARAVRARSTSASREVAQDARARVVATRAVTFAPSTKTSSTSRAGRRRRVVEAGPRGAGRPPPRGWTRARDRGLRRGRRGRARVRRRFRSAFLGVREARGAGRARGDVHES